MVKGGELELLYIIVLDTGMRQGELFALKWPDIDFKACTININKTYKLVRNIDTEKLDGTITEPKSKSSIRVIPLPTHIKKKLLQHRKDQKALKLKMANLYTYATRLFELGENPKTVQKLLGHSSLAITLDTYTHVLDAMKEQTVSKIEDLYASWGTE
jgi:integrase